jgi:phage gp36-like protein
VSYADPADLAQYIDTRVLGRLSSDQGAYTVDLAALLDDASAQIDAALRASGQSTPPGPPYPREVKWLACMLAIGSLYARRPEVEMAEQTRAAVESARTMLDRVATGAVRLTWEQDAGFRAAPAVMPTVWRDSVP